VPDRQPATSWQLVEPFLSNISKENISTMHFPKKAVLIVMLLTLSVAAWAQTAPGVITSEFIYETAPYPECHASTIAESKGTLVAAWFGGTKEKNPDVGIWVARWENGKWNTPVEVANGVESPSKRYPTWNPVLHQPKNGPLLLFYKVGPSPSSWWGMLTTSSDGGKTWSKPVRLPNDIAGPIKNKPVELSNGELLCPSSTEDNGWRVHFERTSDLGKTWERTPPINDGKEFGVIQPTVFFHPGNQLQALFRSRQGKLVEAWSADNGKTWSKLVATSLPNPNSGVDGVTLKDGRHLLVYNHVVTASGKWGRRSLLNVALSQDGKAWQAALVLEAGKPDDEYSYPAVIQTGDGRVHITYTWNRKKVKHVVLDPRKLQLREMKDGEWPAP
jgi:predicted neuraminidase